MTTTASLPKRKFDVVIVGAGGSGMRASLQLARAGLKVAVLSKVFPTRSHTVAAQGGVSASLGNMSEDSWEYHFYDTVKGSDWLGDQDAIEFMCREAPKVVYELEHFGMPFDRNPDGTIYQRPFGGHTANYGEKPVQRACAAADRTGHAMLHTLYQANVSARTTFFVEWMALDLIRDASGDCVGVTALEMETGDTYVLEAKTVLLATGGAGRIFQSSTNAFINTGDGLGMAARSGIALQDMEFWQFHPTGVAGAGVLLTEGCRGEGAILLNSNGERFMERYAPTLKDLAPRDFVSRCMGQEILEGRGCGPNKDYIHMKLDHLGADTIHKRLPSVYEIGVNFANVDVTREPIPVVPTIHYQMGGIPTNIHGQVVERASGEDKPVNGLYAVGECSCVSVHGANRLGTNSLLDLLVFGKAAGDHIIANVDPKKEHKELPKDAADQTLARLARLGQRPGWRVLAGRRQRHARHHADTRRRVPQPGVDGRRRQEDQRPAQPRRRHRPEGQLQGVQHRAHRSAGSRKPDGSRAGHHDQRRRPQGMPRRPPGARLRTRRQPRDLPAGPQRRGVDETHPVVQGRQQPGLQAGAHEAPDCRDGASEARTF